MSIYWSDYIESSCRQNVSFFASSEFLMIAYHTTAIITIPLSVFTFCTIIRVTPNKMIKMKVPLLIALAWSTNLDLMLTINIAPFMFFPSAAGVSMGLLKSTGIPPKWLPYMGQVSVMMIGVCFVMLLENRHSQITTIKFKIRRQRTRLIYFGANYFLAFFIILAFYLDDSNQLEMRQFVFKRIPCPAVEFYDEYAIVLLKGGEFLPFLSITAGLAIVVIPSLFFSLHTIYHLNHVKNAHISEATKALQRKFLSYVAMQVMIPWTALVCPIMYSLYANKYDYYNQALNNFSMLLMASHGLMSTTCTLLLIRPYREFVMSVFRGNREYDAKMMWATNIRSQGSVMLGSATE